MQKVESALSDFELLILLVKEFEKFSYDQLQETAGRIQMKHKLFQTYFDNYGDIEGVAPPESMKLSFHFKVLYKLDYIQRVGTEYKPSEKCREIGRIKDEYDSSSKVIRKMLSTIHLR